MRRDEFMAGLKENWYILAIIVLAAAGGVFGWLSQDTETADVNAAEPGGVNEQALEPAPEPLTEATLRWGPEQERAQKTIAKYEEEIAANPNEESAPAKYLAMGNLYRQKLLNYKEAARCYELVIADYPESDEARTAFLGLDACYAHLNDPVSARWLYEKMMAYFPEDSQEYLYASQQLAP